MLALWTPYHYPEAHQKTFSPNAIKHYLMFPPVINDHTHHLMITLQSSTSLMFPYLPSVLDSSGLHFFNVEIIHPPPSSSHSSSVLQPIVHYANGPSLSRALILQHFGHICDDIIDDMYRLKTLVGIPLKPPPRYDYDCPICRLAKMTQSRKGKTMDTESLGLAERLHIDFVFWYIVSRRGFHAILMVIDANSRTLWLFYTASKKPPLHILWWFFANLRRENRVLSRIHAN
jgi:hypothetical protein